MIVLFVSGGLVYVRIIVALDCCVFCVSRPLHDVTRRALWCCLHVRLSPADMSPQQSEDEDQAQARGRRSRKPKTAKKWSSTLGDWVDQEEPVDAKRSGGSRVRSRSAVADAPEDAAEGRSRRSVRGRGKAGSEGAGDSRSKSAGKEAMVEDGNDEDGGAVSKKRRLESATGAGSQGVNAKRQAVEDAGEGGSSAPVEVKKEAAEEGMGWGAVG